MAFEAGQRGQLASQINVTPLVDAMLVLLDQPAAAQAKRSASRQVWKTRYDAASNFPKFVEHILGQT